MTNSLLIIEEAFKQIQRLESIFGDDIPWNAIEKGFIYENEKIFLANKARGIFKPKQMLRGLLSIKTTIPRAGRVNVYFDRESDEGYFYYSLQKGDPRKQGNKHIWEAYESKSPFIYFYPVAPAFYKAIWPCYITSIYPDKMYCEVVVGTQPEILFVPDIHPAYKIPSTIERKYRVAETRIRVHQAAFREQVLDAYNGRCAISSLPIRTLLEAAHITPDIDLRGDADVTNGIALSRIHHKAFDANLIGIDPDYKIHLSEKLMNTTDGSLLEIGLKGYHGKQLILPKNIRQVPDNGRLEERFSIFQAAQF